MAEAGLQFRHLNLGNEWPQFALAGLVVDVDGSLALARVPSMRAPGSPALDLATSLEGPAGIGVDEDDNLYVADPVNHRILRVDGCDRSVQPLPCFSGPGSEPAQLNGPRGVLVGSRGTLYVADSGNHRVQVVDLVTLHLRGVLGQPDPWGPPQPGADPGRLDDPWDLAADAACRLYVVDHGNHRIQRFDPAGNVDVAFWTAVGAQPEVPQDPTFATMTLVEGSERLLVVDASGPRILVYDLDGTLDQKTTEAWAALPVSGVGGIVFAAGILYVGDPDGKRVLAFDAAGGFLGTASGFGGSVASLALDSKGRILVHPGAPGSVAELAPGTAFATSGSFLAGPFSVTDRATRWHRLKVTADRLPPNAHVRLATCTSDTPAPPAWDPAGIDPASAAAQTLREAGEWRAAPQDATDVLVLHQPARYLWIGGALESDGTSSPVFHQMRLSFDHDSYLRHLPAVYRSADPMSGFLARALELFESELGDTEEAIDNLEQLLDPAVAPDEPPRSWLDWLSTWLDFPLDESWPPDRRRAALAEAFALEGIRGTAEGLRRYVELYADATVSIEEPARAATIWSFGETSRLGFDTMLAGAEAQGAVVGTTAILDHSHLIGDQDYGAPLFEDLAHRFCVHVHEMQASTPEAVHAIRRVIEREKPAHTTYDLCVIGPRMRVGFQARLGIDAIVAGPPSRLTLAGELRLGYDTVLSDRPHAATPSRMDSDSRIGPAHLS